MLEAIALRTEAIAIVNSSAYLLWTCTMGTRWTRPSGSLHGERHQKIAQALLTPTIYLFGLPSTSHLIGLMRLTREKQTPEMHLTQLQRLSMTIMALTDWMDVLLVIVSSIYVVLTNNDVWYFHVFPVIASGQCRWNFLYQLVWLCIGLPDPARTGPAAFA